jgi:leucyl aminopeptidase
MLCYTNESTQKSIPITLVVKNNFSIWLENQTDFIKKWLTNSQFRNEPGSFSLLPDAQGNLTRVICCISKMEDFWNVGNLSLNLPEGEYFFDLDATNQEHFAIAWGLGAYQFTRYKTPTKKPVQLVLSSVKNADHVMNLVESIYLVRDLINTPTDDMGPSELAEAFTQLGTQYNAETKQIIGEDLLKANYPTIYTVGRASDDAPRLLDLTWGNPSHPKITLVGKGVCFDTGGLDIKSSSGMLLMKKDMAGAAHALGLARMIMQAKLPVRLRVLIPAVENAISGNAYRPGDVIKSRKGLTIEIGNTDAEGRVILADALTEAASEQPDLLIDLSTLTGAARVAVGTDLSALFSNNDAVAAAVTQHAEQQMDPVWRLPLFAAYREALNSSIADINNATADSYAGAITAALFLKEFVPDTIPWVHFDIMAWNLKSRPGRPQGGEAMALRALFSYLCSQYRKDA